MTASGDIERLIALRAATLGECGASVVAGGIASVWTERRAPGRQ